MPVWVQIVGGITALVALLVGLWQKVVRPGAGLITTTEQMLPLLRELTDTFSAGQGIFPILNEIAGQFRTDSGSSLRDVVNRLEAAAIEARAASEALKIGVEAAKLMAERDRHQLERFMVNLDRLTVKVDDVSASGDRVEVDRARVALDLADRQSILDAGTTGVAADLAQAQQRAEAVGATSDIGPGAAADAAALPPEEQADHVSEGVGPYVPKGATPGEIAELVAVWNRIERRKKGQP